MGRCPCPSALSPTGDTGVRRVIPYSKRRPAATGRREHRCSRDTRARYCAWISAAAASARSPAAVAPGLCLSEHVQGWSRVIPADAARQPGIVSKWLWWVCSRDAQSRHLCLGVKLLLFFRRKRAPFFSPFFALLLPLCRRRAHRVRLSSCGSPAGALPGCAAPRHLRPLDTTPQSDMSLPARRDSTAKPAGGLPDDPYPPRAAIYS